jgi:hypothetical protein
MNRDSNQQLLTSAFIQGQLTQHIIIAQQENDKAW